VYLFINGKECEVRDEKTVLEVAQREGIYIPTLCHHPALEPYGACRLCLVEVKSGGKPGLTASCALPAFHGLEIETDSPRVKHVRGIVMKLIMAACPDVPAVLELAHNLGVTDTPYEIAEKPKSCVLCGVCVRICNKVGTSAINFAFRGSNRRVCSPFDKTPDVCLGCRACENVCPVGLIKFTEKDGMLIGKPFNNNVEMAVCSQCGKPFAGAPLVSKLSSEFGGNFNICPHCQKTNEGALILKANGGAPYLNSLK